MPTAPREAGTRLAAAFRQWTITSYTLTLASLILLAGSFNDLLT